MFCKECLGTVYMADPVCDDISTTLPLEVYIVTFNSQYYTTSQGKNATTPHTRLLSKPVRFVGRKKLKQVETEIQRLTAIRHSNLLSVFAVKLNMPHSSGPPQLIVLSEQGPALSLQDVLEDCESLREERASVRVTSPPEAFALIVPAGLSWSNPNRPERSTRCRIGASRSNLYFSPNHSPD